MNELLFKALNKLDRRLSSIKLEVKIIVMGSFALELNHISLDRTTRDIDSVKELDYKLKEIVREISHELDLSTDWLSDTCSTIRPLPDGYENRIVRIDGHENINLYSLSLNDLVATKISALFSRGETDLKDLEDLLKIGLTKENIEFGINYIIKAQLPDASKKFQDDFIKNVECLKKELMGKLK